MTPQNRAQAPAEPREQDSARATPASPHEATCSAPGCERKQQRHGLCESHARTNPNRAHALALPGTLPIRPHRTKRIRDQLHQLAETPGLTPDQYERRKAEILRGAKP